MHSRVFHDDEDGIMPFFSNDVVLRVSVVLTDHVPDGVNHDPHRVIDLYGVVDTLDGGDCGCVMAEVLQAIRPSVTRD